MKELAELRDEIRLIDEEMAELFMRRMESVRGVAEYKRTHGLAVSDPAQEQRVIEGRSALISDEEVKPYYIQFLHDLMDVSKLYQHKLLEGRRIAYVPRKDKTAGKAAGSFFPDGTLVEYETYSGAYKAVENNECDAVVLPFEVSYSGEVGKVLDAMFEGSLYINDVCEIADGEETTRYAALSRSDSQLQEPGVGSAFLIMFTVRDEIGGLAKAINMISAYNFNMRIMRSRPMTDLPWHYYFYVEALGNDLSDNGVSMINALKATCPSVKVVGRYRV